MVSSSVFFSVWELRRFEDIDKDDSGYIDWAEFKARVVFFASKKITNLDFGSADFRLRGTIGQFFLGNFLFQFVEGEVKMPGVFLPFTSYQSWFSETRRFFFQE